MNESIRKYWFVEARHENGQTNRVSDDCHTIKTAQKKARYYRNKTGIETSVIEVIETVITKKAFKVLNKYQPNPKEEISVKDQDLD
jgi:hypothetical protein